MRLVDAEYVKAVMLNGRLMQGNAEFTLYAQQVETQVNALPGIDLIFCKDCKHYQQTQKGKPFKYHRRYCNRGATRATELNDFCSCGERGDE